MPKSPNRFHMLPLQGSHGNKFCQQQVVVSPFFGIPGGGRFSPSNPRKVSFEDGNRSDSDASLPPTAATTFVPCHEGLSSSRKNHQEEDQPSQSPICSTATSLLRRKRPALVRPTTSLSLVDLANQMNDEDENGGHPPSNRHQHDDNNDNDGDSYHEGRRAVKRLYSPQASPHCSFSFPSNNPPTPLALGPRASPWGHFVDTVPEEEEALILVSPPPTGTSTPRPYFFADHVDGDVGRGMGGTAYPSTPSPSSIIGNHHDHSCHCCTSCRIRRASPYSKNRRRQRAGTDAGTATTVQPQPPLTFLQLQESFKIPSSSSVDADADGRPRFRLSPRKPVRGAGSSFGINNSNRREETINPLDVDVADTSHHDGVEPTTQLIGAFTGLQVRHHQEEPGGVMVPLPNRRSRINPSSYN
jgi:hypothetical protein